MRYRWLQIGLLLCIVLVLVWLLVSQFMGTKATSEVNDPLVSPGWLGAALCPSHVKVEIERRTAIYNYLRIVLSITDNKLSVVAARLRIAETYIGAARLQLDGPRAVVTFLSPSDDDTQHSLLLGALQLLLSNGCLIELTPEEAYKSRKEFFSSNPPTFSYCHDNYISFLPKKGTVLEVGSRARSGATYRHLLPPGLEYTGMDIIAGTNVDVVGDAHQLSSYFPGKEFDAIFCNSVFEHLLMPWKAALEMNRVMKTGGIVVVCTHQTLGMHDMPWDFWRFSDTSWHAIFNEATGFEIVKSCVNEPVHIIPAFMGPDFPAAGLEGSYGFLRSCAAARKVSAIHDGVSWNVSLSKIVVGMYPPGEYQKTKEVSAALTLLEQS